MRVLVLTCLVVLSHLAACRAVSIAKCFKNDTSYEVIAHTRLGKVRGSCDYVLGEGRSDKKGANIYSWLGIPYAKPPVNERRFRPPEPVEEWHGELDARSLPKSCMQVVNPPRSDTATNAYRLNTESLSSASEDCLYLNVFSPAEAFLKTDMNNLNYKAPVMVFFHGVGYTKGSSVLDIYDPSVFSALSGIVVVTFNYRLGVFGFLHLNDTNETGELIEGNQALLDQHMALKWISSHIDSFGGDPSKITVAGQGVGGVFASFHLFYKPSWPLFRNMILQSASPLNPVLAPISSEQATKRTKAMLAMLKCKNTSALTCAQSIDAGLLLNASTHLFNTVMLKGNRDASSYLRSAFKPVLDGRFFSSSPKELLYSGQYKSCNILTGFTANEGAIHLPRTGLFAGAKLEEIAKRRSFSFSELVGFLTKYYDFYPDWPTRNSRLFMNTVLNEYTGLTIDNYKNPSSSHLVKSNYLGTLEKIIGDELVVCPAKSLSEAFSRKSKVFLYRFEHKISTSLWPSWFGAVHGDELAMTFAHTLAVQPFSSFNASKNPWLPVSAKSYTEEEKTLGKEIFGLWITFIRTDNPNSPNRYRAKNSEKDWPDFTLPESPRTSKVSNKKNQPPPKDSLYLVLKVNGTKLGRSFKNDECNMWNNLIPSIVKEITNQQNRQTTNAQKNVTEIAKTQETTQPTTTTTTEATTTTTTTAVTATALQNATTTASTTTTTTTFEFDFFDFS